MYAHYAKKKGGPFYGSVSTPLSPIVCSVSVACTFWRVVAFLAFVRRARLEDPSKWRYEFAFLFRLLFGHFLKVLWAPSFCSFQRWADHDIASLKFQENLCMETAAKQNFVWENVVKTENEWHFDLRLCPCDSDPFQFVHEFNANVRVYHFRPLWALVHVRSPCSLCSKWILKMVLLWITVTLFIYFIYFNICQVQAWNCRWYGFNSRKGKSPCY